MITLHAYILRELLRTFGLTLVAVTALFTLGGGIFNVMTQEGIGAADIVRFLPMLIPIVLTLTMPMAALYAGTAVYGRLAADNELVACRSAGINVHRLFLPALLLAVFVAVFTNASANYLIPGFMRQVSQFARKNIGGIVAGKLRSDGYFRYEREKRSWFVTAEEVRAESDSAMRERGFQTGPGLSYLSARKPTLLQLDDTQAVRFASAEWALCLFDTRGPAVEVSGLVIDGRDFQLGQRVVRLERQRFGPIAVPVPLPSKPSWADLPTLFLWARQPWLNDDEKIGGRIDEFLALMTRLRFYRYCLEELGRARRLLVLDDDQGGRVEISAAEALARPDGRPELHQVEVRWHRRGLERPVLYRAALADIIARPVGVASLLIELRIIGSARAPVQEFNPRAEDTTRPVHKETVHIDGLLMPAGLAAEVAQYSRRSVIDPSCELDLPQEMLDRRAGLQRAAANLQRKVAALIHFRIGFSSSALVTVLMGAALGVIFRGARALAAFGLAFVPFAAVGIIMLMGRQIAEHPGTEAAGWSVIWGGLLVLAAADLLILRLGVRR